MTRKPGIPAEEISIDWERSRTFFRDLLSRKLHRADGDTIEDLTQESLVRLVRALRSERPRNLDALMTSIGQRAAIDHIRRRTRWGLIVEPMSDVVMDNAKGDRAAPDQIGDPLERVCFVVLEFFQQTKSDCLNLARAFFEERDWATVAEAVGKSHAAIRRQWSRCLDVLRGEVSRNPSLEPLNDWISK